MELHSEILIRTATFLGLVFLLSALEFIFPFRKSVQFMGKRKLQNLFFGFFNIIILRISVAAGLIGVARWVSDREYGILNALELPHWVEVIVAFLFLDLFLYFQHYWMHNQKLLWRLHRFHHSDLEFDMTTGLRFHPIEILFSFFLKSAAVLAIGAPILTVLIFEVVLSSLSLFSHSNFHIPEKFEGVLRRLVITPDYHRVHHSVERRETDSNYGFHLTVWDYLFGTYVARTARPPGEMPIGIEQFREAKDQRLFSLLVQPFR